MQRNAISFLASCGLILLCICNAAATKADDLGTISKNAEADMIREPGTPRVGAKDPQITVVEYFDYNCPFCKKLNPPLSALLKADPSVALIYKDWPILGDVSAYAAGLALAAKWQGKYIVAHDVLMNATRLASNSQVESLLAGAKVDVTQLKQDRAAHASEIEALLHRNDMEVRSFGIRGTPGLLVGRHIVSGVYDVAGLEQAVARARLDR